MKNRVKMGRFCSFLAWKRVFLAEAEGQLPDNSWGEFSVFQFMGLTGWNGQVRATSCQRGQGQLAYGYAVAQLKGGGSRGSFAGPLVWCGGFRLVLVFGDDDVLIRYRHGFVVGLVHLHQNR